MHTVDKTYVVWRRKTNFSILFYSINTVSSPCLEKVFLFVCPAWPAAHRRTTYEAHTHQMFWWNWKSVEIMFFLRLRIKIDALHRIQNMRSTHMRALSTCLTQTRICWTYTYSTYNSSICACMYGQTKILKSQVPKNRPKIGLDGVCKHFKAL
jgi:hypothetical protein